MNTGHPPDQARIHAWASLQVDTLRVAGQPSPEVAQIPEGASSRPAGERPRLIPAFGASGPHPTPQDRRPEPELTSPPCPGGRSPPAPAAGPAALKPPAVAAQQRALLVLELRRPRCITSNFAARAAQTLSANSRNSGPPVPFRRALSGEEKPRDHISAALERPAGLPNTWCSSFPRSHPDHSGRAQLAGTVRRLWSLGKARPLPARPGLPRRHRPAPAAEEYRLPTRAQRFLTASAVATTRPVSPGIEDAQAQARPLSSASSARPVGLVPHVISRHGRPDRRPPDPTRQPSACARSCASSRPKTQGRALRPRGPDRPAAAAPARHGLPASAPAQPSRATARLSPVVDPQSGSCRPRPFPRGWQHLKPGTWSR